MKVQDIIGNELGILGELEAIDFLNEKGFEVIASNVKFGKIGELDIVAKDGDTLVFVEVKDRDNAEFSNPLAAVTKSKMSKIVKCAEMYIAENKIEFNEIRFDVIAITRDNIEHIKNAFYGRWY